MLLKEKFQTALDNNQRKALEFALSHKKCGLFLEAGIGKTLIALNYLYLLKQTQNIKKNVLVVSMKTIVNGNWKQEIEKWNIPLECESLCYDFKKNKTLSKKKRLEKYEEAIKNQNEHKIYLINYELLPDLIENSSEWSFDTVILDESHLFKSYKSNGFKKLKPLFDKIDKMLLLTATPMPNDKTDLWTQINLIDNGERLGKTITSFREKYCKPGYIDKNTGFPTTYVIRNEECSKQIDEKIKDVILHLKNEVKLPEKHLYNVPFELDNTSKRYYKDLKDPKKRFIEIDDYIISCQNAGVAECKLQQIANGCVYLNSDETEANEYSILNTERYKLCNRLIKKIWEKKKHLS